jgi:glycosyltransferase involved in cell wall biosynthesis
MPRLIFDVSHNLDPNWRWIAPALTSDTCRFRFFDCVPRNYLERYIRKPYVPRYRATFHAAQCARRDKPDLVVTHSPLITAWFAFFAHKLLVGPRQLAFAFNFTDLPKGRRRKMMVGAFRQVDRFVVPSSLECRLYSEYFEQDPAKFNMLRWGIERPLAVDEAPREIAFDYICAVGSQGRDYHTLMSAVRTLPEVRLVLVATPASLAGIRVPSNVSVFQNIPLHRTLNLMRHAKAIVVPLRDSQVPCGHVTLVLAMHMGKAIIVTDSEGVADYVSRKNALLVPAHESMILARNIEALLADNGLASLLGRTGQQFAAEYCTEASTVNYFSGYLEQIGLA